MDMQLQESAYQIKIKSSICSYSILKEAGYHEYDLVPCLFKHETRKISFCLFVDDLSVKHTNNEDIQHLIDSILPRCFKCRYIQTCTHNSISYQKKHTMRGAVQSVLLLYYYGIGKDWIS